MASHEDRAALLESLRNQPVGGAERAGLVERYLEGDCLALAFALHWATGWPVEAVSARGGDRFLHFAAIAPDGSVWDAAGPRDKDEAAAAWTPHPVWERVDALRLATTGPGALDEDAVTEAFVTAARLFGPGLDRFLVRVPVVPERLVPGAR